MSNIRLDYKYNKFEFFFFLKPRGLGHHFEDALSLNIYTNMPKLLSNLFVIIALKSN